MTDPLRVSYSAVQDWRQCQQLYTYRHVDKLRPKVRYAAPELGTFIHSYFERYYGALIRERNLNPLELHKKALKRTLKEYKPTIQSLAALADGLGAEDEAKALLAIPLTAQRLIKAYYRVRGRSDADQHIVLLAEHKFELPVDGKHIGLPGKIDMVTQTADGIWLWEHKTTGNIPSQGRRFRDLQTLLYKVAVEEIFNLEVTGVVWNYVRTLRPQPPKLLARGGLSVATGQTTTIELFHRAIKQAGLDVVAYQPFLRQLERKEREVMFPRHTLPLVQAEDVLLRDYVASVYEIEAARNNPKYVPIRNISAQCDWCPMVKLCTAAVAGGDTRELIKRYYTVDDYQKGTKRGKA